MVECAPGNGGVQMSVRVAELERRIVRYRNNYIFAKSYLQRREFVVCCGSVDGGGVIKREGWDVTRSIGFGPSFKSPTPVPPGDVSLAGVLSPDLAGLLPSTQL